MPRRYMDGWHTIGGYDVRVEDGYVMNAVKTVNGGEVPAAPYCYVPKYHCWVDVYGQVKAETFRRGMYEGRYIVS